MTPRGSGSNREVDDLRRAWAELLTPHTASPARAETGEALIASWAEPSRRYHDLAHLRDVLSGVDELLAHAGNPDAVRLAAWYHDAIYRGHPDDEEASAARAETELIHLGLDPRLISEVVRLVRLTVTHDPAPGDLDGETLCDADLAILASPPERYARYTDAVRAEYAHVPDDQFRAGRSQLLDALLDGPSLFRTPHGRHRWETPARANLTTELHTLTT
jgi:predicted metal-dependent HD superfamily phosphohydrolase